MKDRFIKWEKPIIKHGELNKYNWLVLYPKNLILGNKVDIGAFTLLQSQEGIIIDDNVQIGSHCSIYSISTIDNKKGLIHIKENAKIGSHCIVMPNITIGKNSIIGANSFINKDIPDNVLAYGTPVKIIKTLNEK